MACLHRRREDGTGIVEEGDGGPPSRQYDAGCCLSKPVRSDLGEAGDVDERAARAVGLQRQSHGLG